MFGVAPPEAPGTGGAIPTAVEAWMVLSDRQKKEAAEWYDLLAPLRDEPGNRHYRPGMTPRQLAREIERSRSVVHRKVALWRTGRRDAAGRLVAPSRCKAALASSPPGPKRGNFRSIPDPAEVLHIEDLFLQCASRTGRTKRLTGLVMDELRARERLTEIKAPSYHAVERVKQRMDRGLLEGAAGGMKALTAKVLPQAVTSRPVGPNVLWTADQWICDWFSKGDDGELIRLVAIPVVDNYDGCIVGLAVGPELNGYLVVEAIIDAIRAKPDADPFLQGRCDALRTDLGREFWTDQLASGCETIGTQKQSRTPGLPQGGALQESVHRILATKLAPRFPYYAPPDIKTKPIRREAPLTCAESASRLRLFCLHEFNNMRGGKGVPTRLERRRSSNFVPVVIPEDELRVAFMRRRLVTVTQQGVKVDRTIYQEDRLPSLAGQQVVVLEDHRDLASVQVHHEGKFFCVAVNPLAADAQFDDAKRRQFLRDRRELGKATMAIVSERLLAARTKEDYLTREAEQLAARAKGQKPGRTVRALIQGDPLAAQAVKQVGPTGPPVKRWPALRRKYRP